MDSRETDRQTETVNYEDQLRADMNAEGAAMVRLRVQAGLVGPRDMEVTLAWLAEQESADLASALAERTQEACIARQEKRMQARVNTVLIIIASMGVIIALLSWLFPLR
jgi:hypothetical protein